MKKLQPSYLKKIAGGFTMGGIHATDNGYKIDIANMYIGGSGDVSISNRNNKFHFQIGDANIVAKKDGTVVSGANYISSIPGTRFADIG